MIQKNIPLSDKNWFRTGGNARYYAQVDCTDAWKEALLFAHNQNLEMIVLGTGANVVISDDGFDGLVIRPIMNTIQHTEQENGDVFVSAEAGATIPALINYCLSNNILGLEEFSGIPGTVGGSTYNNLHYFQHSLSDFFHEGSIIEKETGTVHTKPASWFNFGYDQSTLHNKQTFLLSAIFKLKKGTDLETAHARGRQKEIMRHRFSRYPTAGTCGSFFRNFHDDEVTQMIKGTDKKMIYVAYYLDKLGIKGELSVGDIAVSHQHANMLVNKGNGTSADIIALARTMQQKVYNAFGIIPQPECELIGFKTYPLL